MEKGHCSIDYDDYIEHHGIEGQRWGIRNGPPYPLGSGKQKFSRREILRGDNQPSYYAKKKARLYAEEYRKNGNRAPDKKHGFSNKNSGGGRNSSSKNKNEYKSTKEVKADAASKDGEKKILKKWDSMSKESKMMVVVGLGILTAASIGGGYIMLNKDMVKKYPGLTKKYVDDVLPDLDPNGKAALDAAMSLEREKLPKNFKPVDFDDTDSYLLYKVLSENEGDTNSTKAICDAVTDRAKKSWGRSEHNHVDNLKDIKDALNDTNPLRYSKLEIDDDQLAKIQKTYVSNAFVNTHTVRDTNTFNTNCPYTSWTYELRRRGEDVVAQPASGLYSDVMEVHASKYFDLQPNAVGKYRIDLDETKSVMKNRSFKESTLTEILSPQILEQYGGENSRGQLLVPGHSMNWEIRDGKVYYSCAQQNMNNHAATAYLNELVPKSFWGNQEFKTIRLDNAPVKSDAVLDFCTKEYAKDSNGNLAVNVDSIMSVYESEQLKTNINNLLYKAFNDNDNSFEDYIDNNPASEEAKLLEIIGNLYDEEQLTNFMAEQYTGQLQEDRKIKKK
jgi:hypothetical protein